VIAGGASIGAFNAVAVLCRYPDAFSAAIGMSGSYRLERFYDEACSQDLYFAAPLQFLPGLEGPQLDRLRQLQVVLAAGEGAWADGTQLILWAMGHGAAHPLGSVGVQYVIWTAAGPEDLDRCERVLKSRSAHQHSRSSAAVTLVEGRDPDDIPVMIAYPGPDQ